MDSGALVPDVLMVEMMVGAISNAVDSGFVLDGFPRTVNQAIKLDKALAHNQQKIDMVLNLKIEEATVTRRMTGRRSCPKCGAVYHIENLKPNVEGICDSDGTRLVQRPDDALEVVANRFKTYFQQTEPVVDYYRENNTVYDIDASKAADKVTDLIFESLNAINLASKREN
jgi:adenylate kinase